MLLAASDSVDGTCLGMFDMSSAADDMKPTWYAAACCMFHSDKVDMADMGFCPRVGAKLEVGAKLSVMERPLRCLLVSMSPHGHVEALHLQLHGVEVALLGIGSPTAPEFAGKCV
jgi:hypothetical protein